MRKVYLHGRLGERYGREFLLDVRDAREAVRALGCQLPGFFAQVAESAYHIFVEGRHGLSYLTEGELAFSPGAGRAIHIFPVPQGAGDDGLGKVIAGVALIAVTGGLASGAEVFSVFGAEVTAGVIRTLGLSLALGGVSLLLSPTPNLDAVRREADPNRSTLFNGAVNVTEQGVAIPVVYGRCRVGSIVVSSAITQIDRYGDFLDHGPAVIGRSAIPFLEGEDT